MTKLSNLPLLVMVAGIFSIALFIHCYAALTAYPIPGDAAHFVQHGIAWAKGNPNGMSTYWSQGMIALAAFFFRLGLDPAKGLQHVCVICGSLVVVIGALTAWKVFQQSRRVFAATGLLLGTSTALSQYSVCAYSEMPFILFLTLALFVVMVGWEKEQKRGYIYSAVLLGLGAYFKAMDACVWAAWITFCIMISGYRTCKTRIVFHGLLFGACFALLLLPLVFMTYQKTGRIAPTTKGGNLALGDSWSDSKAVYSLDHDSPLWERKGYYERSGSLAFIWRYRKTIMRRVVRNCLEACRIYSNQLFYRAFRLGTGFFLMGLTGVIFFCIRERRIWRQSLLLLGGVFFHTGLVSLNFIHDRLVLSNAIILMVLFGGIAAYATFHIPRRFTAVFLLLCIYYLGQNSLYAIHAFQREPFYWRYQNTQQVGEYLKKNFDDKTRIMVRFPHIAVHFYTNQLFRYVEMPYGEIQEIERFVDKNKVDLVIISDRWYVHWPINQLLAGASLPDNWFEYSQIVCSGDEERGIPMERYVIYKIDKRDSM
ncbi:MAG: hypothetical protein EOM12_04455 [Verrucomicrobiae bacterium]|nr:hypothetical protein [Verrucomicrobiae bacterium]